MVAHNKTPDALKNSIADTIALCHAVQDRFLDLCHAHLRIRGEQLPIPESMDSDLLRWRTMMGRFKRGDYRNTHSEFRSLKYIAEWTVRMNQELRSQPVTDWELGDKVS